MSSIPFFTAHEHRLAGFIFTHPVFRILRPSANSNERMKEWRLPAPAAILWAPVWTLCRLDIKASHRSTLMRCKWEMKHKLYSRCPPAGGDISHWKTRRNLVCLMAPRFSSLSKICLGCSLHRRHKSNLNPGGLVASQHFVAKKTIHFLHFCCF